MAAQGRLHHVGHGELRRAVDLLQPLDRGAEVLLPLVLEVEGIQLLEDAVQDALDAVGGDARVGQRRHHLGQARKAT